MRHTQIRWPLHRPEIHIDFEFKFGQLDPHYHPLNWIISKWYPNPRSSPVLQFDRFRIRQEMKQNTPKWQNFMKEIRHFLDTQFHIDSNPFDATEIHLTIRCREWFPKVPPATTSAAPLTSLSTQIWQARKVVRALRDCTAASIFQGWHHLAKFRRSHKQLRLFNRQNKKQRLKKFLQEGADFALRNQTYDWFRRVRKLCPKQISQKIQLFDMHR